MLTKHYSEGELMFEKEFECCEPRIAKDVREAVMEIRYDGYEAAVTLRDDVWALEEPGTLNLSRAQAQTLRRMLNQLGSKMDADYSDEDG
jgi:hypothetical protein